MVRSIQAIEIDGYPIDFGVNINADELTVLLRRGAFNFKVFELKAEQAHFQKFALDSGILGKGESLDGFANAYRLEANRLFALDASYVERIAQILSLYLVELLLAEGRKISFETVFSHPSKVELLNRAKALGYKVYLYFVSTEDPEINVSRVVQRVGAGGHAVEEGKVRSRYYNSMENLYDGARYAYQAYFFDNSFHNRLVAHFKVDGKGEKIWDQVEAAALPAWFRKYYSDKNESLRKATDVGDTLPIRV